MGALCEEPVARPQQVIAHKGLRCVAVPVANGFIDGGVLGEYMLQSSRCHL